MRLVGAHLDWCALRNLRESTIYQRRRALTRLHRTTGGPLDLLDEPTLADWHRTLTRITPEARHLEIVHVAQFFRWLVLEGHRDHDPTARLPRPKIRRRLPRPIPDADLAIALAAAPDRVRPWLFLAAFSGLRAAEIAGLRREDVLERADPPVIVVVDGKGGKQRVVPLHPQVADALHALTGKRGPFWHNQRTGAALPSHRVSQEANRFLHSVGVESTLHQLRHWFGTEVYRATRDLRLTQELMGHASPVTTAGYAAFSPGRSADAVRALAVASTLL